MILVLPLDFVKPFAEGRQFMNGKITPPKVNIEVKRNLWKQ